MNHKQHVAFRKTTSILVVLLIFLIVAPVAVFAERGQFNWYRPSGANYRNTNTGTFPTGKSSYTDSGGYDCAESGQYKVRFCSIEGTSACTSQINAHYVNYDANLKDCDCLGGGDGESCSNGETKCWVNNKCCGDDGGADDYCSGGYTACVDGYYRTNPDSYSLACECGNSGTQAECNADGEVGCWDSTTLDCCGDDGAADDFCAGSYTSCYDGTFRNDGDYNTYVCECGFGGAQGSCDSEGEIGCWSGDGSQYNCCGDDGAADDYCSGDYTSCLDGTFYTDGDSNLETCECGSGVPYWDGFCDDTDNQCWDTNLLIPKCCGDDDNINDYFYTENVGGCVGYATGAVYDTDEPVITDILADTSEKYYYNKTSSTTGIVYFNSDIASGESITFTVDWDDENSAYEKDYVSAFNSGGLAGTSSGSSGPIGTFSYSFNYGDDNGTLNIYARDAVWLNDTKPIVFEEDTTLPTGSIIINDDEPFADNARVNLTMAYNDNIGVRDCAYSNDNIEWTYWQECAQNKSWNLIDEDGRQYVYYKIRDFAGNTYVTNDSIFLDRSMPGIIINDDAAYTSSADVILSINFETILGDIMNCSFRNDSMEWTSWETCPVYPDPLHPVMNWTLENTGWGERTVSIKINTSFGVIKENNDTIIYDPTLPNGSIVIYSITVPGIQESNKQNTAYSTVDLILQYSDNEGIAGCRYANDENLEANFTPWESCTSLKTWVLNEEEGLRRVYYQVKDNAGNINESYDTIYLNKTGAGIDVTPPSRAADIVDDGEWTNDSTRLHATWSGAYDRESEILTIPLLYYYSIGTSNDTDSPNATDVVGWTYAGTDTEMMHTGLNLSDGVKYYINVRTVNSADLYNDSSSDGITVDTIACQMNPLSSSTHDNAIWSNKSQSNNPQFSWSGDGGGSGVYGYSYILDQNHNGVPDLIPEGDPDNFAGKTSTIYSSIIDGNLYFHVRCKDNAGNWGAEKDYEIRIDTSMPSTPQMTDHEFETDQTSITFNWTASYEPHSHPVTYVFELYNNSIFNETYLVNRTDRTELHITVFDLVSGVTYYPRVMAWNLAELNSSWSSEVSTVIDNEGPDISIIIPGSACNVRSLSPVIRVETDEWASCKFKKDISSNVQYDFDYTESIYHESKTSVSEEDGYIFNVECRDSIGNYADKNRTFAATPNHIISIDSISPAARYYTGRIYEIPVQLASQLGGVDESEFTVQINGTNLSAEEFAITDIGCGNYKLTLTVPDIEGAYALDVYAASSSASGTLNVFDLNFSISYSNVSSWKELNKIAYGIAGNATVVGIATESYSSNTNAGVVLNVISNSLDAPSYLFAAKSSSYLRSADQKLEEKEFSEIINPNFGSEVKKFRYTTALKLSYADAQMYGFSQLMPGRYTMLIRNTGTDPDTGKGNIEIVVSG